jgi:hypothetical protein
MVLTSSGLIDAWGGLEDIESRAIRILQPPQGEQFRNPQATAEQFALLPSFLVGLTVACRLWTRWVHRREEEQRKRCPDLEYSLSGAIGKILKVEKPINWTPRIHQRVTKLANVLRDTPTVVGQQQRQIMPQNLRDSIAALVDVVSASYSALHLAASVEGRPQIPVAIATVDVAPAKQRPFPRPRPAAEILEKTAAAMLAPARGTD